MGPSENMNSKYLFYDYDFTADFKVVYENVQRELRPSVYNKPKRATSRSSISKSDPKQQQQQQQQLLKQLDTYKGIIRNQDHKIAQLEKQIEALQTNNNNHH